MNELPKKLATHDEIMNQLWNTAANGNSRETRVAARNYLFDRVLDTISEISA